MPRFLTSGVWLVILWALLTFASLAMRPLMPVDETRYASVAWEMWLRHDFLVPHLNGETYSHKPPLLFWLMQASWWLFGVNDWSLRLISPLFALATLGLTKQVALELWPEKKEVAGIAPFVLLGSGIWIFFSTLTMFDIMLTFFALFGIYSLLRIVNHPWSYRRWLWLGAAIGGGVLTKGPVILLHLLPVALLAPWWLTKAKTGFAWKHWYAGVLLAVLTGAAIALAWAIPAGTAGGQAYRNAIFLGQTTGRVVDSFAHKLPFWWYLQILPLFLLPWLLTKPFWLSLKALNFGQSGVRFCAAWLLPVFIAFSLVSGKRVHYLLPLVPGIALLVAYGYSRLSGIEWRRAGLVFLVFLLFTGLVLMALPWLNAKFHWRTELAMLSPGWGIGLVITTALLAYLRPHEAGQSAGFIATASILGMLIMAGGFFSVFGERFDTAPPAQKIAQLQASQSNLVLYTDKYHGQFHFTGRLSQAIPLISGYQSLLTYAAEHPEDLLAVFYAKLPKDREPLFTYRFPLKNQTVGFVRGQTLLDNPDIKAWFLH